MTLRRYEPSPAPLNERNLPEYVLRELRRIAFAFQEYSENIAAVESSLSAISVNITAEPGLSVSASTKVKLDISALTTASLSLSDKVVLAYDASASAHVKVSLGDLIAAVAAGADDTRWNPRTDLWIVEDFMHVPGTTGQGGWDALVSGTGASVAAPTTDAALVGHPGVILLSTGVTAAGYAGVIRQIDSTSTAQGGLRVGGNAGTIKVGFVFRLLSPLPSGAAIAFPRIGLMDEIQGVPTNGVYMTADASLSGSAVWGLVLASRVASVTTAAGPGFAPSANVWYHGEIEIASDGLSAVLSIQPEGGARVYAATLSATLTTALLTPAAQYANSTGSVNYQMWADLIVVHQRFTTPRWT